MDEDEFSRMVREEHASVSAQIARIEEAINVKRRRIQLLRSYLDGLNMAVRALDKLKEEEKP